MSLPDIADCGPRFDLGGDDRPGGGDVIPADDDEEDPMIPIQHPNVSAIEEALGPVAEDGADEWCYICKVANLQDPASLSDETRQLLKAVAEGRKKYSGNMIVLTQKIKRDYDDLIYTRGVEAARAAQRQVPDTVRPWTLRAIYAHIRFHDTSTAGTIDNTIDDLKELAQTLKENGLYVAPRTALRNGRLADRRRMRVAREEYLMYMGALQKLAIYEKLRADVCEDEAGATGEKQTRGKSGRAVVSSVSELGTAAAGGKPTHDPVKTTPIPVFK